MHPHFLGSKVCHDIKLTVSIHVQHSTSLRCHCRLSKVPPAAVQLQLKALLGHCQVRHIVQAPGIVACQHRQVHAAACQGRRTTLAHVLSMLQWGTGPQDIISVRACKRSNLFPSKPP